MGHKGKHVKRKAIVNAVLAGTLLCWAALGNTAAAKPSVFINEPTVGEGVSTSVQRHLNIEKLLAEIEASIQTARKFEVLSRDTDKLKVIRKEQKFSQSNLTQGNAAATGGIKNANYVVIPNVADFVFYRSTKPVPNLRDKFVRRDSGRLEIDAQLLDTTTGAIKTTFYMKASFATKDQVVNERGGVPSATHFTSMAKKIAAQISDQLIDAVFPMKVMQAQGNQVFINRGADGGLESGDTLNVYHPGLALIDPDTGENLGSAEMFAGTIKVVRVNPKFTICEVVTTEGSPIASGDIVRKP